MARIHHPSSLCCLLNPHGRCSACTLKLCQDCFSDHLEKNDCEVQLKFSSKHDEGPYTFHTSMKCSLLGKPAIYVEVDTDLNL